MTAAADSFLSVARAAISLLILLLASWWAVWCQKAQRRRTAIRRAAATRIGGDTGAFHRPSAYHVRAHCITLSGSVRAGIFLVLPPCPATGTAVPALDSELCYRHVLPREQLCLLSTQNLMDVHSR